MKGNTEVGSETPLLGQGGERWHRQRGGGSNAVVVADLPIACRTNDQPLLQRLRRSKPLLDKGGEFRFAAFVPRIPNHESFALNLSDCSEDKTMPYIEHVRDTLTGSITDDYLQKRIHEGWKPVLIEWEREVAGEQREGPRVRVGTPYGLRVADDCLNLERDPAETSVLTLLLELVREEGPFSRIAATLNTQGFRTRRGTKWTEVDIFKLLPRLIDAAPDLRRTQRKAVNRDS